MRDEKQRMSKSPRPPESIRRPARGVVRAFSLRAPAEDRCNPPLLRPPAGRERKACARDADGLRYVQRRRTATANRFRAFCETGLECRRACHRHPSPPQRSATLANAPVQAGRDMRNIILVRREVKGREFCYNAVHDKAA
jgi:hypothetical protein